MRLYVKGIDEKNEARLRARNSLLVMVDLDLELYVQKRVDDSR